MNILINAFILVVTVMSKGAPKGSGMSGMSSMRKGGSGSGSGGGVFTPSPSPCGHPCGHRVGIGEHDPVGIGDGQSHNAVQQGRCSFAHLRQPFRWDLRRYLRT